MNKLSGSHYFLRMFTNTALSLCECKLVLCSLLRRVYVGRICNSIVKDSKFDWTIQVKLKRRVIGKLDSFKQTILV